MQNDNMDFKRMSDADIELELDHIGQPRYRDICAELYRRIQELKEQVNAPRQ